MSSADHYNVAALIKDGLSQTLHRKVLSSLKKDVMAVFEKELDTLLKQRVKAFVIEDVQAVRDAIQLSEEVFVHVREDK